MYSRVQMMLFKARMAASPREIARAALESMAYQTSDLIEAMRGDWPAATAPQRIYALASHALG